MWLKLTRINGMTDELNLGQVFLALTYEVRRRTRLAKGQISLICNMFFFHLVTKRAKKVNQSRVLVKQFLEKQSNSM